MIKEKNKIKVVLTTFGSLSAVSIPLKLNKDSYRTTDIECLIPKTINSTDKSIVKIYANTVDSAGNKIWGSQTYNLPFEKDIKIDGFEYEVYCGDFPEEFCKINGSLELTFAYGTLNENDEFSSILPSSTLNLNISGNGYNPAGIVIAPHDVTAAKVNQLTQIKVDKVESEKGFVLVTDGDGGMNPSKLPIKEFEDQKAYIEKLDKEQKEYIDELNSKQNEAMTFKADLINGLVPSHQLPSYVDDALEFVDFESFPAVGETGKIYVDLSNNLIYRWSGSVYTEISKSLAIGETENTAYRGDRGKIAFDHSQTQGNPHGVTTEHLGLDKVNNTADVDKPISTAQQEALNLKVNIADIVDNCGSTETNKPVSANQARLLKEETTLNSNARHSHENKALLDTYNQSNSNLTDAVSKRHSHLNKTTLDATTEIFNTDQKSKVENAIKSVSMNGTTGVFTFVKNDGTSFTLDTLLEKVVVNFHYDSVGKKLVLEHEDGTTQEIEMSAFINIYTGVDGTEITVAVSSDNKISATIKNGIIGESKLSSSLLAKINAKADASSLGAVALSNNYNDLDDLPNIPEGVVMYSGTGQNTDGSITQKGVSDLLTQLNSNIKEVNNNITKVHEEIISEAQSRALEDTEMKTSISNLQMADNQNVKITGNQTVAGVKNFTGTFQINGKTISYDSATDTFTI